MLYNFTSPVQNSSTDSTTTTYTKSTDLADVTSTSTYYLEGVEDEKYEVIFGDHVLGKAVSTGNIVTLSYIVTNGADSNGASSFSLSGTIAGSSTATITTASNSSGGADEAFDSIHFNIEQYASQKDVTTKDYESE